MPPEPDAEGGTAALNPADCLLVDGLSAERTACPIRSAGRVFNDERR
jgi:hypothetical protein